MAKRKGKKHRGQSRRGASAKAKKSNNKKANGDGEHASPPNDHSVKDVVENGSLKKRWSVIGLANLRNTCYFNSVLQLLLSSTSLQEFFGGMEDRLLPASAAVTSALCELFNTALAQGERRIQYKPSRTLGAIRAVEPTFKSRTQHDAHELMISLLRHLVDEAGFLDEKSGKWMEERFSGRLTSIITCTNCGCIKSREEGFLILSISVMKDVCMETTTVKGHPLSDMALELPDITERDDSQALQHLNPTTSGSTSENNEAEDCTTEISERESDKDDDTFAALQDLFATEEQSEEEDVLSYDKQISETENNVFFEIAAPRKGKKKGKHRGKKKADRFDAFDFEEMDTTALSDVHRFQTIEECLQHFFAHERVTWRCSAEYPERRVTFSTQAPEVFSVPSKCKSRCGNWKRYTNGGDLIDEGASSSNEADSNGTVPNEISNNTDITNPDTKHTPPDTTSAQESTPAGVDTATSEKENMETANASKAESEEQEGEDEKAEEPVNKTEDENEISTEESTDEDPPQKEACVDQNSTERTNETKNHLGDQKSEIKETNENSGTDESRTEDDRDEAESLIELSANIPFSPKPCLKKEKSISPPLELPQLNSIKQYFLWRPPRVLCIHLKRFQALNHRRISKLNHDVEFQSTIQLSEFMDSKSPFTEDMQYDLKAVVCHTGSLNFGHYTAYVSRMVGETQQWYDVSDADVRKASLSEVLKSQAYILLYERKETTSPCSDAKEESS